MSRQPQSPEAPGRFPPAAGLAGFLLAFAACTPPALEVEFAGCADVLAPPAAPTCAMDPHHRELRLWASSEAGARIAVEAGGQLQAPPEELQGGRLLRLEVEAGAPAVVLRAARGLRSRRFALPLVWWPEGAEPGLGQLLKRRAELEAGGNPGAAAALFAEAAEAFRREGRIRSEIDARTRRHHLLYSELGDDRGAQEALDALPEIAAGDGRSALLVALFRAPWKIRQGRFRSAFRELREAQARAERLDDPWIVFTRQPQSYLASRLGLYDQARETIEWLRRRADGLEHPCRRADLFTDLGWSQLLILEAGGAAEPVADLETALGLAVDCAPSQRTNIALNLALARLHRERPEEALEALRSALAATPEPPPWLAQWSLVVAGRIALAGGRGEEALERFRDLQGRAGRSLLPDMRWRAAVGRARALEALGRPGEALAAYSEAEDLLDGGELEVPFAGGRGPESAFVFFERGTRFHLDLLVRGGRLGEALALARRSRRRALRRLAAAARLDSLSPPAAARWSRLQGRYGAVRSALEALASEERGAAADALERIASRRKALEGELDGLVTEVLTLLAADPHSRARPRRRPPPPGEVLLAYHPLPRGWVGFAAHEGGVEMVRLSLPDLAGAPPDSLSTALLAPFAATLGDAERVRILPFGPLWRVDFHALPLGSSVLLERAPVVYSLDLPGGRPRSPPRRGRALLLEDPSRSLVRAGDEVRAVAGALEAADGWQVERLEASRADAISLPGAWARGPVELFHFAGHGGMAGGGRLDPGLVLGAGSRLTVADILTCRWVPATVVLSACAAIGAERGAAPVSLGVGQAFLLAGGRQVVGPVGPVDDGAAADLVERFYRFWPGAPAAQALQRAQLALREERPGQGWASFRIIER